MTDNDFDGTIQNLSAGMVTTVDIETMAFNAGRLSYRHVKPSFIQ